MPFNGPFRATRMRRFSAADQCFPILIPLFLFICLWGVFPLTAQTSPSPAPDALASGNTKTVTVPPSTQASDKVILGFCRFDTSGIDPGLEYLGQALPEAWAARLKQPLFRKPDLAAALKSRRKAFLQEVVAGEKKVSDALELRDRTWLKGSPNQATRRSLDSQIDRARADLLRIRAKESGMEAEVESALPAFQSVDCSKLAPDSILEAVDAHDDPGARARNGGVDLLVWGQFHSINRVLFLEIHLYDAVLDMELFSDDWPLDETDYTSSGAALLDRLMPAVLGFDSASIELLPEAPEARISLKSPGGLDYGTDIGRRTWNWLMPGTYVATAYVDAAYPEARVLELKAGDHLQAILATVLKEKKLIHLESQPSGANVHDGVAWTGTTPMDLDTGTSGGIVVMKLDGYEDLMIPLSDILATPGVPEAPYLGTLKPKVLNWRNELDLRRNAFYDSLGMFILSVAPAIVFNALTDNIRSRLSSSTGISDSAEASLVSEGNLYYYMGLGSIFLSAVMFTDMGIKLSEYLGVADAADGR